MAMGETFDAIVVGGGVIGMTSAWRLAQTGRKILLLERSYTGAEASSAAAGMLGAQLEVSAPGAFYQLCLESRSLYQTFVDELFEQTGMDAQFAHNGIYHLAFSEEEGDALRSRMQWQIAGGARAEFVSGEEIASRYPVLAPNNGALHLPDDSNVSAPLLMRALSMAVNQLCTVVEGAEVLNIDRQGVDYTVTTQSSSYACASVVVASGAWAKRFLSSFPCDIHPVKGQLLSIRPKGGNRLAHTVFHDHTYMVPKRDGSIVVGATEDRHAGFNKDVTIDAIERLLADVKRIAPGLADAVFERSWTGIRPGSSDAKPWIGELPESPGFHVAVGHFRNGILLAPVTANMLVAAMEGQPWPAHWQAFHVARQVAGNEVTR